MVEAAASESRVLSTDLYALYRFILFIKGLGLVKEQTTFTNPIDKS